MGMIAQDAAEIVPEVVNQGNIWGVSYGHVVGLLVEAIKEQQNQIEDLKNQIKNK
jgi:hypothetical protein